ncbi:cytidylyltransferase domain-containing protein [Magnetospirillum gryphiswaldense]|uniref:Cytidylyltransferase family protein n=1 Tax=Magnetospirillum gryphiswaldense TaxID=55518 RepID=A4U170_9PROT|nr:acylneuraminate cytidylyltransferase [Magnetospirillum gryphiswaldense]AVM75592.1 3-deoxy-manno-octulosonate cytidylyltransferase [Magnetospirillum gryphiswaldense MSR-1]AVM79495.1 3-deoxy-manno-octulosonate cytidylyltransferase [Magnetospirillum gryphiswaldense]CAM76627.1 Cytidylyltransferase family protein [Magnetospirillum gryphiswaldense MSR-1]
MIGIVLQARASSSRLPGKVLRPMAAIPLLTRCVTRLRQCRRAQAVIVATSDRADDDKVAELAAQSGALVHRGPLEDVLERYLGCARSFGLTTIVRATADNPFVDPALADDLIDAHGAEGWEYGLPQPGLPVGIGVECFSLTGLERSARDGLAPHHREHVNEYILENPGLFVCGQVPVAAALVAPDLRLTVDTPEDFARAERAIAAHGAQGLVGGPDTAWLIAYRHLYDL